MTIAQIMAQMRASFEKLYHLTKELCEAPDTEARFFALREAHAAFTAFCHEMELVDSELFGLSLEVREMARAEDRERGGEA